MKNALALDIITDTDMHLKVRISKPGRIRITDENIPKRQVNRLILETDAYTDGDTDPLGCLAVKNIVRAAYIVDEVAEDGSIAEDWMIESIREGVAALLLNETSYAAHECGRALRGCIIASLTICPPGTINA
jgi:hypothetical protein